MTDSVLLMPRLGETMEDGVLVGWLVEPGKPFKRGDPLVEIETDKTVAEFPALSDGVLVEPLVQIGDRVKVGTPIARLDVPGEAVASSSGRGRVTRTAMLQTLVRILRSGPATATDDCTCDCTWRPRNGNRDRAYRNAALADSARAQIG
jgi:pyruvate/2-oxoglutarate dehydrogenase complex dihydrolipoamide acyltransferase (E2) component